MEPATMTEKPPPGTVANADHDPEELAEQEAMEKGQHKRETWSRGIDFLLACIGFSVGLGNVWRFPYLCYKNGGGAFLIPYFLFVVFGGIPLFYLEVAVGQYMSKGGLQAWNLVPLFQAVSHITSFVLGLTRILHHRVSPQLLLQRHLVVGVLLHVQLVHLRAALGDVRPRLEHPELLGGLQGDRQQDRDERVLSHGPVVEFWENQVLKISSGLDEMGTVKWDLALCLLFAWIVVYACICKGIKSSGKVMYVTATSPYIFMLILLIRNATLDGASDGVDFYLRANLTKLKETSVWVDAGTQIFFSSSIALGTLTALGSYNKFKYNSYRDSIIFALVNSATSFFAGFIVFTILGFMAKQQNRTIDDVAESGPGLAFIAYPKAVAQMPLSPLWSILFFFMVILLGLDSQFVGVEGVVTTIVDQFPDLLRKGYRKEMFIGCCCIVMFFVGLSMVTEGGMYVFQLFDYYSGSRIILLIAFFELIAVIYVYGLNRFCDNILMMIGDSWLRHTLVYMKVCWVVLSPIFCMAVFVMSAIDYSELKYARPNRPEYVYPDWGVGIGWAMAASSAVWIPLVALYKMYKTGFDKKAMKLLLVPYHLKAHQKRPQDQYEDCLKDWEDRMANTQEQDPPRYNPSTGSVNMGYQHGKDTPSTAENNRF